MNEVSDGLVEEYR